MAFYCQTWVKKQIRQMNAREKFLSVMGFEPNNETLLWEFGYWPETLRRWYKEGLPYKARRPELNGVNWVAGDAGLASSIKKSR